jgi:hypothetical protein
MPAIRSWLLVVGLLLSLTATAVHMAVPREAVIMTATTSLAGFQSTDPVLDANSDSVADVPEATTGYDAVTPVIAVLRALSGVDQAVLWEIERTTANDLFANQVLVIDDATDDQVSDILVTAPRVGVGTDTVGRAYLISGETGQIVREFTGPEDRHIGLDIYSIPDEDGDLVDDVLIEGGTVLGNGAVRPYTYLFSTSTGELLGAFRAPIEALLERVAINDPLYASGDVDADGDVDRNDILLFFEGYASNDLAIADIDRDGELNAEDLGALIANLGESTGFFALSTEEAADYLASWNAMYPDAAATSFEGVELQGGTGDCCGVINPAEFGECSVQISGCPTHSLPLYEEITLTASGIPTGGTYYWVVTGPAAIVGSATNPSVTIRTTGIGTVDVCVIYIDGDGCHACAHCSFNVKECFVELYGCLPGYNANIYDIFPIGSPEGGTYEWSITGDTGAIVSMWGGQAMRHIVLDFWQTSTIHIEVTYTVGSCTTSTSCSIGGGPSAPDTDGDGLPDYLDPCWQDPDCDDDGFSDRCEVILRSDPLNANSTPDLGRDSDLDGLSDFEEVCTTRHTNHLRFDSDMDGVQDYAEILLASWGYDFDPNNPDTDGDGLKDGEEATYALFDADGDGIIDEYERDMGWDPSRIDTDGDGVPDGEEIDSGDSPGGGSSGGAGSGDVIPSHCPPGSIDRDMDGLCDVLEKLLGTNPDYFDSDNDGLPDGWEYENGLDPLSDDSDGDGTEDGLEDSDGDGLNNFDEYTYGTDPLDTDSDKDGVSDGDEVDQGSDPNDISDGGEPPASDHVVELDLQVGDPSTSQSERWQLTVGSIRHKGKLGAVTPPRTFKFKRGKSYKVTLQHLGSKRSPPDYDWIASIILNGSGAVIEDVTPILGSHDDSPAFRNGVAWLHIPLQDVDVDSDNDNGYALPESSEEEDDLESEGFGKLLFARFGDQDTDGIRDFADGYNSDGASETDAEQRDDADLNTRFTPLVLRAAGFKADDEPTFEIDYAVEPLGGSAGPIRLWRTNESARDKRSLAVGGDFIPPGTYTAGQLGISLNGEPLVIYIETVSAVGTSAGTGTVSVVAHSTTYGTRADSVRVTPVGTQFVPVERGPLGNPQLTTPTQVLPISHPTPTIDLVFRSVTSPRPHPADPSKLIADLHLIGSVDDAIADLIESPLLLVPEGVIESVQVVVNGGTPEDVEVGYTKDPGAGGPSHILDPYDYAGTFNRILGNVEIQPGWNHIQIRAMNSTGLVGVLSFDVQVDLTLKEGVEEPESYADYDIAVGAYGVTEASGGGVFSPVLIELLMPESVVGLIDTFEFGTGSYKIVTVEGRHFAAIDVNEVLTPRAFVVTSWFPFRSADLDEYIEDPLVPTDQYGYAAFYRGLGAGLIDTGVDVRDGVVSVAKGAWHIGYHYNPASTRIRVLQGESEILVEDQQRLAAAAGVIEQVAPVVWELVQDTNAAVEAAIMGDHATLNQLGGEYAVYVEIVFEIIDELRAELATMSDYEAGRLTGRIVGEIGLIAATSGAGAALKSSTIVAVASKMKLTRLVAKYGDETFNPVIEALDRVPDRAAVLMTSEVCFVAGTPVWTKKGVMSIENVEVGDYVLARDPETGVQLLKRVVRTIVTRPTELYMVKYGIDADRDGAAEAAGSVITTAEHPFYVESLGEFVAAASLVSGQPLSLAQATGTTAHVSDIQIERGPPALDTARHGWDGYAFVTYNLEVEDFHTYFVGNEGVWVHNDGGAECQRVLRALAERITRHYPDNPAIAYISLRHQMTGMSDKVNQGLVYKVLQDIKDMNTAGTLSPRWQALGFDPAVNQFREREVFAGVRFEAAFPGRTLSRPATPVPYDFVDDLGYLWDVKGTLPELGDFDGLLFSVRERLDNPSLTHIRLIVDVAGLGTEEVSQMRTLLQGYDPLRYELLE